MIKRILSTILLTLSCSFVYANGGTYVTPNPHPFFIFVGGGYSSSENAGIENPNPLVWDVATQGYDSDLGNSEFYSAGLGFEISQLLSLNVEVTRRPSYEYSKFQTTPASIQQDLGARTRNFKFDNTSVMLNATFYGAGFPGHPLVWHITQGLSLQPFVDVGVGVSYNTVSDFHTVLARTIPSRQNRNQVVSVGNENTETSFSWQLEAGADMHIHKRFKIDLGYRYFDGGNFAGPNYIYAIANNVTSGLIVPPWKGEFKAQEAFVNLYYTFV